jgi:HTH-type transcriptional regulator/antitoxin HigA
LRIEKIWEAKQDTIQGDELEILSILIEKYEKENFDILSPDPIEAIKFKMEQMNLEKKDLARIIGSNRTAEILQRKRKLSLQMIRDLHKTLKIPTESLLE